MYLTPILELSRDDLSDTTPTWTDITAYLLEAQWSCGVQKEGDTPQAGQMSFVLDDRTRRFEPDYAAGAYYPDIVPMRRLRWRITSSAVTYAEAVGYVEAWQPSWPGEAVNQETTVAAVDGFGVLAQDDLLGLDPPEAETYEDVVGFDQPWGYWRLGEAQGTAAAALFRKVFRGSGRNRRKVKVRRGTRYRTAEEAGGVTGPAGVYRNLPELGQPGLISGDRGTAVRFTTAGGVQQSMRVPLPDTESLGRRAVAVEMWIERTADTDGAVRGPVSGANPLWQLAISGSTATFALRLGGITVTVSGAVGVASQMYLCGIWDGSLARLYSGAGGTLSVVDEESIGGVFDTAAADGFVEIASSIITGDTLLAQELAVYEHGLTPERVDAHYTAGAARGMLQQTAGERMTTHLLSRLPSLWSMGDVQTTGRELVPQMMRGQPRLEEAAESSHAEGPRTMVFFQGDGDPKYLGHEWQATAAAYNTVQTTVGNNTGETPYTDIELVHDFEVYNDIVVSHEGGEEANTVNAASVSKYGRRVNTEWTDVLLVEHNEVESLASHVEGFYSAPAFRPVSVTLDGDNETARLQILTRQIGDLVRVKHRPKGGTAIDRVANIIGWDKHLGRGDTAERGKLTCTWYLSRGFNAADGFWHAGVAGFTEAGSTTVAA